MVSDIDTDHMISFFQQHRWSKEIISQFEGNYIGLQCIWAEYWCFMQLFSQTLHSEKPNCGEVSMLTTKPLNRKRPKVGKATKHWCKLHDGIIVLHALCSIIILNIIKAKHFKKQVIICTCERFILTCIPLLFCAPDKMDEVLRKEIAMIMTTRTLKTDLSRGGTNGGKSTGATNNTNHGSVPVRCVSKPWQWVTCIFQISWILFYANSSLSLASCSLYLKI